LTRFQVILINERFGENVSLEEFHRKFKATEGKRMSFVDFYKQEVAFRDLAHVTAKAHLNTLRKLQAVQAEIYFDQLTYNLVERFDKYLRAEGLAGETIWKHHKDIKTYINRAILQDYMDANANPYLKFKVKTRKSTPKEVLLMEEIDRIEDLKQKELSEHMAEIRDFYLLCLYTGMRWSDASTLAPCHLTKSKNGWMIRKPMVKNSRHKQKEIYIPLYSLFHFEGEPESRANRHIKLIQMKYYRGKATPFFGHLSNPVANRRLKDLAKLAEIDKHLTIHTARRAFASNLAPKIKGSTLQQLMGHDKFDTTTIYIKQNQQILDMALEKVRW
jgi:site-specific recombinase XerD